MKLELVRDWMSREVITVTPGAVLPKAARLMIDHKIRRLPVVDDGRLVGIITYSDVRNAKPPDASSLSMWEMNYQLSQLAMFEIMTSDPITVSRDATIGEAAQLMLENKIGALPVLDNESKLIGIITESDIFRMVVRDWLRSNDEPAEPYAHYG